MRKAFWIISLVVSLGIGLWVSPIGVMLVGVIDVTRSLHTKESLRNRSDLADIAQACVSLLLKTDSMRVFTGEDERLPMVIRNLCANSVMCTQWEVEIELHGGFDHFGYRFVQRYRPNTPALFLYTEGSSELLLELPKAVPEKGQEEDEALSLDATIKTSL